MQDTLLFELLDINQFKKLHHSVVVRNLTSNTLVGRDGPISIIEFLERGVIIKADPKSIAMGHTVSILFKNDHIFEKLAALPDVGRVKGAFEVIGKVNKLEHNLNDQIISIEFTQFDNIMWEKFFYLYKMRQKQINGLVGQSEQVTQT